MTRSDMEISAGRLIVELAGVGLNYRRHGHVSHTGATLRRVPWDGDEVRLEVRPDGCLWATGRCHSGRIRHREEFIEFALFMAGKKRIDESTN